MFRLIRYNLRNQITRVSTYVTPIVIFIIIMAIKALMNVDSGLMNVFNNIGNEFFFMSKGFFVELSIFIGSLIFVGMVINNIYKGPREDGSIMTIVSKPMKRRDMILGNLLSLGICIFMYGLLLFALYGISTTLDNGSSADKILDSVSILIGVIIIMLIFASIILLVGSFMSSRSLITFSIVAGAFIPLISIVISLTAEPELTTADKYKSVNAQDFIENNDVQEMYLNLSKSVGEVYQHQELSTGKTDLYKSLSYIDPWYQLSGLFTLFNTHNHVHINWIQEQEKNSGTILLDGKKYSLATDVMKDINLRNDLSTIAYNIKDQSYLDAISKVSTQINSMSFEQQMMMMGLLLNEGTLSSAKNKIHDFVLNVENSDASSIEQKFQGATPTELMLLNKLESLGIITQSQHTNIVAGHSYENGQISFLLEDGKIIDVFKSNVYINKTYLFIFWGLIAVAFFGLTTLVEFKRDILPN